jgi:UDP-galactopyranose mutase
MLSASSWDITQARMAGLIADLMGLRTGATNPALLVAAE